MSSKLASLKASNDPAEEHYSFLIGTVPATAAKPAHEIILAQCTHYTNSKAWVSWCRLRAQLSGDGVKALANGVTACTVAPCSIHAKFCQIIDDGNAMSAARTALAKGRRAVEIAEAAPQSKF